MAPRNWLALVSRLPLNGVRTGVSPFMKKLLLVVGSAFFALAVQANTIVFDDLGPGGTYDPSHGYDIGQFGDIDLPNIGARFTAGATGSLATIDIALTRAGFQGIVNVFLYGDAGGSPNDANQTFLTRLSPAATFGTSNNSLASFTVTGNVSVTEGSAYWLVLKPASGHGGGVWNYSLSTLGTVGRDYFGWTTFADSALPGFRITAGSAVPDSGNTFLLLLGSVAILIVLKRMVPDYRTVR